MATLEPHHHEVGKAVLETKPAQKLRFLPRHSHHLVTQPRPVTPGDRELTPPCGNPFIPFLADSTSKASPTPSPELFHAASHLRGLQSPSSGAPPLWVSPRSKCPQVGKQSLGGDDHPVLPRLCFLPRADLVAPPGETSREVNNPLLSSPEETAGREQRSSKVPLKGPVTEARVVSRLRPAAALGSPGHARKTGGLSSDVCRTWELPGSLARNLKVLSHPNPPTSTRMTGPASSNNSTPTWDYYFKTVFL